DGEVAVALEVGDRRAAESVGRRGRLNEVGVGAARAEHAPELAHEPARLVASRARAALRVQVAVLAGANEGEERRPPHRGDGDGSARLVAKLLYERLIQVLGPLRDGPS